MDTAIDAISKLDRQSFSDDDGLRARALAEARKLCTRLETPYESSARMIVMEVSISTLNHSLLTS